MKLFRLKKENQKPTALFYLIWSSPVLGSCIATTLLGYVTYYCTNVLGLAPLLVGNLLLASKLFDGASDLLAGFIVDHTDTKIGRGRPYDIAYILMGVFTIFMFQAPNMGTVGTAIYVFVIYTLIFSVFQTLYSCANPVYLSRAVEKEDSQVSITSFAGFLGIVGALIVAMLIPQFIAQVGTSKEGWSQMSIKLMIPCIILSSIRIFFIKESRNTGIKSQKINFKEGIGLLFKNNYMLVFAGALLLVNIATNMSSTVNTYYFQYIFGDIKPLSLVSLGGMLGSFSILVFPQLVKKMGIRKLCQVGLIIGVIGKMLPLLGLKVLGIQVAGSILGGLGYMPVYMLASIVVINCMDYGEWKFGKRGEGIYSCITGFCSKVGTGLAAWLIGAITALGAFDGTLEVQSASANTSILLLYTVIPAALYAVSIIAMHFYKLDKKLPQIHQELEERRKASV
ncbi:MAG: MFS transporter [Lachnospiraceae bacterium]|nr:MFS transporter [Lachnospiraceae bacterium]